MSRNAEISWQDPQNTGDGNLTGFWIQVKKGNFLVQNITTSYKVNKYEANNLMPYTTYEISVAARNKNGIGEESIISFMTAEEGQCIKRYIKIELKFDVSYVLN